MRTTVGHRGGRKSTVGVFRLCASAGKKRDKKRRRGGVGAKTPLCPACYKRSSARLASRTASLEWSEVGLETREADGWNEARDEYEARYKERKRERENGKKERRRRRRKKGASARNNAQSHGEECGPSGYTRIHERTWWVPIGRPSILSSQREDTRGLFSTGDKYTGEFTALPVVTSFRLFQVNRARGRVANRDSSFVDDPCGGSATQMTMRHIAPRQLLLFLVVKIRRERLFTFG